MSFMERFRNIIYPYQNEDDTFIARGYHVNQIVDALNDSQSGAIVDVIASTGISDLVIGRQDTIDAIFIDYSYKTGDTVVNRNQSGHIKVENSNSEATPVISWTRESVVHTAGTEEDVTFEFVIDGYNLVMRVTNSSGYDLSLAYTAKIMKYESN